MIACVGYIYVQKIKFSIIYDTVIQPVHYTSIVIFDTMTESVHWQVLDFLVLVMHLKIQPVHNVMWSTEN